jgi:hypothetical protein
VTASITSVTTPTGTTPVPFGVNYTVTTANTGGISSTNTVVQVAISWYNGTAWVPVASGSVASEVAAAPDGTSTQSFVVDYPLLTEANFNNSNLPNGRYFINVSFSATNNIAPSAGALGAGLSSATTNASNYVTLSSFSVSVVASSTMATFQALPYNLFWNVTAPGGSTVTQTVTILDQTPTAPLPAPQLVNMFSPTFVVGGPQHLSLSGALICSMNYSGCNESLYNLPVTHHYTITVSATVLSGGGNRTAFTTQGGFFVAVGLNGSAKAAQQSYGGVSGGIGNVTIWAFYNGTSITAANLIVKTPTGAIALTASVLTSASGPKTGKATWVPTAAGNYTVELVLNNSAGQSYTSAVVTVPVIATGGAVVTKNYWNNATLIPGLSTAASAALLLVVGLVVGLIVALLLARMMWARPKTEPAQPWQAQAATHECSVCHQTFASDEELKEHAKTAHGIQ